MAKNNKWGNSWVSFLTAKVSRQKGGFDSSNKAQVVICIANIRLCRNDYAFEMGNENDINKYKLFHLIYVCVYK